MHKAPVQEAPHYAQKKGASLPPQTEGPQKNPNKQALLVSPGLLPLPHAPFTCLISPQVLTLHQSRHNNTGLFLQVCIFLQRVP